MEEVIRINKYHTALVRTLSTITGRSFDIDPAFNESKDYSFKWHSIGVLAIAVWELEAIHGVDFDRHPEWESAATATFEYLLEHCSRCGNKQSSPIQPVFCWNCRQDISDDHFHSIMDGRVAQEVLAFAEDLAQDGL